jgi:hypothetical protein
VVSPHPEATRRFFWHVYLSSRLDNDHEWTYVPVSAALMERELGVRATEDIWFCLYSGETRLMRYRGEDKYAGRSRTFAIPAEVRDLIDSSLPRPKDVEASRTVDPFSGKAYEGRVDKQYQTNEHGRSYPPIISDALSELRRGGCPAQLDAAHEHVESLATARDRAKEEWEAAGRLDAGREASAYETALGRWRVDRYCLDRIIKTRPATAEPGVYLCVPWYARKLQSTGRITEIGGLQNCSKYMRHAALAELRQSYGVRNYDLEASQVRGLVQLFEDANISTLWLADYLKADKAELAREIFGDRERKAVLKNCVLALAMGATMPTTTDTWQTGRGAQRTQSIAAIIRDAFGSGSATALTEEKLRLLRAYVKPFLRDRNAWHQWLDNDTEYGRLATAGRGGRYVRNAVGMKLKVSALAEHERKSKGKLTAHLLQGLEAAFIHRLAALAPMHGFSAVNNQHDGLLTVGEVPAAAVEHAQAESGLRYASLIEKPYSAALLVPGLT